ncbi:MAG: glucose 1-dehydrogenase [Myxococcota bacterium]
MTGRLDGKVALITGAAKGIGRATAELFAREGAKVVALDRDEAGAHATAAACGAGSLALSCNVADKADVEKAVLRVVEAFGRVDVLVNNAGITRDISLLKMEENQWDDVIDVNLKGVFLMGQAVARVMVQKATGGVILNASSVVATYGNFGQSNYVATKTGVIGLTKVWARELGRKGVRVNAVAPGFIKTDMTAAMPADILSTMQQRTPMNRLGEPVDIARAYLFLASDEASFITGQVLGVDGGLVMGT